MTRVIRTARRAEQAYALSHTKLASVSKQLRLGTWNVKTRSELTDELSGDRSDEDREKKKASRCHPLPALHGSFEERALSRALSPSPTKRPDDNTDVWRSFQWYEASKHWR